MGELADDMIEGRACSWCGMYFKKEYSTPALCKDCEEEGTEKEVEGFILTGEEL